MDCMKKSFVVIAIFLMLTVSVFASEGPTRGYAAFFYFSPPEQDNTVYDDFSHYLNGISPWLKENGIVVSFHPRSPIDLKLASGEAMSFKPDELDLGFVLIAPDGKNETYYGVHTDVDIMLVANGFFER